MQMTDFTIALQGPFSLEAAAGFGFGPRRGDRAPGAATMRLAFCVDGFREVAGVTLQQGPDGVVHGTVAGARDVAAVRAQVARILSLDHDGTAWAALGGRDAVQGHLQSTYPGLRPVLFHLPYEGAAWAIIANRQTRRQATATRDRLAATLGATFTLAGERCTAFPTPGRMLAAGPLPGLPEEKARRLRELAAAALAGRLDPARLAALPHAVALADLRTLRGIGPFAAGLVLIRATGLADVPPTDEPRARAAAAHYYGLPSTPDPAAFAALAERWRPFRTWALVLLHVAGDRAGLPDVAGGPTATGND